MNCDDFLPAMETGGRLQRRRARRHAAGCPRCAAVAARFAAVKRQWAEAAPLSDRERQLWERAAHAEIETDRPLYITSAGRRIPWALAAGLAAAACVLIVIALIARHKPDQTISKITPPRPLPQTTQVSPPSPGLVRVTPVDEVAALAGLSSAVDGLEAEMRELRSQAARADAREQVALVLSRFERPY